MAQPPARRPRTLRLLYVAVVIVFGLFHYVAQHDHYVPDGRSYVDWNARGLAISMAGMTMGLWAIVWLNRRYSK